jgi:hypothetical protein
MLPEVHVGSAPSGSGPAVLGAMLGVGGVIEGAILDVGGTLSLGSGAGGIAVLAETAALLATLGAALGVAGVLGVGTALGVTDNAVAATVGFGGAIVAEVLTPGTAALLLEGDPLELLSVPSNSPPLQPASNTSGSMLTKCRGARAATCGNARGDDCLVDFMGALR